MEIKHVSLSVRIKPTFLPSKTVLLPKGTLQASPCHTFTCCSRGNTHRNIITHNNCVIISCTNFTADWKSNICTSIWSKHSLHLCCNKVNFYTSVALNLIYCETDIIVRRQNRVIKACLLKYESRESDSDQCCTP
jgi:hypothetical protein